MSVVNLRARRALRVILVYPAALEIEVDLVGRRVISQRVRREGPLLRALAGQELVPLPPDHPMRVAALRVAEPPPWEPEPAAASAA